MSTLLLLIITGLGLAGLYFLLSAGLSLIYGLMNVLNLAHGVFFAFGGYTTWLVMKDFGAIGNLFLRFIIAVVISAVVGLLLGLVIERALIARSYHNHVNQLLLTIGLGFALVALIGALFSYNAKTIVEPQWFLDTTSIGGARIPNSRLLVLAVALILFVVIMLFLTKTRHGLIIRAGVDNRTMVQALGIDVDRSFALVFSLGGALATIGGALAAAYFNSITPSLGTDQLIFAFIIVIIGGLGSIPGTGMAAVVVALIQELMNYYVSSGWGDIAVVLLLAVVLLVRPSGLLGKVVV